MTYIVKSFIQIAEYSSNIKLIFAGGGGEGGGSKRYEKAI
jgi:hypothetical protein